MPSDIVMDEKKNEPNEELLQTPLRGILRNHNEDIDNHKLIENRLVYTCLILLWVFMITPIIIICSIRFWL
jgi:hypothetical protein